MSSRKPFVFSTKRSGSTLLVLYLSSIHGIGYAGEIFTKTSPEHTGDPIRCDPQEFLDWLNANWNHNVINKIHSNQLCPSLYDTLIEFLVNNEYDVHVPIRDLVDTFRSQCFVSATKKFNMTEIEASEYDWGSITVSPDDIGSAYSVIKCNEYLKLFMSKLDHYYAWNFDTLVELSKGRVTGSSLLSDHYPEFDMGVAEETLQSQVLCMNSNPDKFLSYRNYNPLPTK